MILAVLSCLALFAADGTYGRQEGLTVALPDTNTQTASTTVFIFRTHGHANHANMPAVKHYSSVLREVCRFVVIFDSTKSSTGLRDLIELSVGSNFEVFEVSGNRIIGQYPQIDWDSLHIHVGYINREVKPSFISRNNHFFTITCVASHSIFAIMATARHERSKVSVR